MRLRGRPLFFQPERISAEIPRKWFKVSKNIGIQFPVPEKTLKVTRMWEKQGKAKKLETQTLNISLAQEINNYGEILAKPRRQTSFRENEPGSSDFEKG